VEPGELYEPERLAESTPEQIGRNLVISSDVSPKHQACDIAPRIIHQQDLYVRRVGLFYTEARKMHNAGAPSHMSKRSPPAKLKAVIRFCYGEKGLNADRFVQSAWLLGEG
jgi:hypothetical protein